MELPESPPLAGGEAARREARSSKTSSVHAAKLKCLFAALPEGPVGEAEGWAETFSLPSFPPRPPRDAGAQTGRGARGPRLQPQLPVGPINEASLELVVGWGFFRSAVNIPLGGSHPLDLMVGGAD